AGRPARWTVRRIAERLNGNLVPHVGKEMIRIFLLHHDQAAWEKRWCVAELNDCIAKIEEVLETYERLYNPRELVVRLDEPGRCMRMFVPLLPRRQYARRDAITNTGARHAPAITAIIKAPLWRTFPVAALTCSSATRTA